MRINKLKILLMPIYCFLIILWSASQCMEAAECQLTLVGENHSTITGMKYCYEEMKEFATNNLQGELNFFVEKDKQRLSNAYKEQELLFSFIKQDAEEMGYIDPVEYIERNDTLNIMKKHIGFLKSSNQKLYNEVYTNIIGKNLEDGLIKNRAYFLSILYFQLLCLKEGKKINIISIDGSFTQVTNHPEFQKVLNSNSLLQGYYEGSKFDGISKQGCIDNIMCHKQIVPIRDQIMTNNLNSQVRSNTRNIAIVGHDHVTKIKEAMEQNSIRVECPDLR
jgi:hypothetical protein